MNDPLREAGYSCRLLMRHRGPVLLALITLTLAIGICTTVLSVSDVVLRGELAFPTPDRVVLLTQSNLSLGLSRFWISPGNYLDLREQNHVFSSLAAFAEREYNLTGIATPVRVASADASDNFFDTLGVSAMLGRTFKPGDEGVCILSHRLWLAAFGADSAVIGRSVSLDGRPYQVIGVMPAAFQVPSSAEIWRPLVFDAVLRANRGFHWYFCVGRLRSGVSLAQAQAGLEVLTNQLGERYPVDNRGWHNEIVSYRDDLVRGTRPMLIALSVSVAIVLLLASLSVGNLLLTRLSGRRHELAVRMALGSSLWQVRRLALLDGLILTLASAAAALIVSWYAIRLVPVVLPRQAQLSNLQTIPLNVAAFWFTAGAALFTALIAGLLPSLTVSGLNPLESLRDGSRTSTPHASVLRRFMIVGQIAFSLALLGGAGLLVRSLFRLQQADPGFVSADLVSAQVRLSVTAYPSEMRRIEFFRRAVEKLSVLPGVESAAATTAIPLGGGDYEWSFDIEGRPAVKSIAERPIAIRIAVTPGYFHTLAIPLIAGRFLADQDRQSIVIDQAAANRYWPGENPIGQRARYFINSPDWFTIVGVVSNIKQRGMFAAPYPTIYVPFERSPENMAVVVVRSPVAGLPIRAVIQDLDNEATMQAPQALRDVLEAALWRQKVLGSLLALFAAVASLLTGTGIYSVMSYVVAVSRKELAIRMALGASSRDILAWMGREALPLVAAGIGLGLFAAWAMGRNLSALLYGVSPSDPVVFVGVSAFMIGATLFAIGEPAHRAIRVEPRIALE